MIYITSEQLQELDLIPTKGLNNGGCLYYKTDEILYKIFSSTSFINEKERNVDFLLSKNIPYAATPKEKIILDGNFCGYSLINFDNSKTFREESNLGYLERIKIVRDIYSALRQIHKLDIFLGDVHRDNFLYKESVVEATIIDFEEIRFNDDKFRFRTYYKIRKTEDASKAIKENANTDNIKAIAASLSFIYGVDLEQFLVVNSIEVLIKVLKMLNIPCMQKLENCLTNYNGKVLYFDEILDNFSMQDFNLNQTKVKEIKRKYIF